MSTGTKRAWQQAANDAQAFRALFDGCASRWEIAGSVRRCVDLVSDVEHVVIPCMGEAPVPGSMFGETAQMNLLGARLDELVSNGTLKKHVYELHDANGIVKGTRCMWGDRYRGVDFNGHLHEVFSADTRNWGSILCIRTGPAEFSQAMVTALHPRGLQHDRGYVRYKRDPTQIYPCATEGDFFVACGRAYVDPKDRR